MSKKRKKFSPQSKLERLFSVGSKSIRTDDKHIKNQHLSKKFLRSWMDNQDWILRQMYLQTTHLQDKVTELELIQSSPKKGKKLQHIVKIEVKKAFKSEICEKRQDDKHEDLENMVKEMFTDSRDLMKALELHVVRVEEEFQEDRETVINIMEKVEEIRTRDDSIKKT